LGVRLKRGPTFIHIQKDFIGETAGNGALAKLSLCINVTVEFIWIAWQVGVVTNHRWIVFDTPRPGAGNNGRQLAYFGIAEGIRRLAKIIRKSPRERQFIQRMNPVRPEVIELPISVGVTLLQGVVGTHAQIQGNNVGLNVWEMIEYTWQADRLSVRSEDV